MQPIVGVVQHYEWGDEAFLPALLGVETDGRPWAELWLGTHPNGPATLPDGRPLDDVTGLLPYLLKVLSVGRPLSLQAHPDAEHARLGHRAGRYPDPFAKPELLCALTPFEAFCGVRPVDATIDLLGELGADELATVVRHDGVGEALQALYRGRLHVDPIIHAAAGSERDEARWVQRLAASYPGDPSVAVTLLLNLVRLLPGEALVLGPGNLHAYLAGAGIELMGASDNVVRGGLTTKPVDVDDLLQVVDVTALADPITEPAIVYPLAGTSIRLLRLDGPTHRIADGHELVVMTDGRTGYLGAGAGLDVPTGVTAYVAMSDER
ncbi:MAG: mannose-6-phosphate isomerase, class I [Ilumatobacteraceae bacterium]